MRLTLWQQFSSNHSAGFRIVGEFPDAQAAKEAEATLRGIFTSLEQWIETNPEQANQLQQEFAKLSPLEETLKQRYGIEWEVTLLEWLVPAHEIGCVGDAITVVDNLVLLGNPTETWSGGFPLIALVEKLAPSVKVDSEPLERRLIVTLQFAAPDEAAADEIEQALMKDYYLKIVPWLAYYGGRLAEEPDKLARDVLAGIEWTKRYFKNWEAERDNPERKRLQGQISASNTLEENERILAALHDLELKLGLVSVLETAYGAAWQRNNEMNFHLRPPDIQRSGLNFRLENFFGSHNAFAGLVAWLRANGCAVAYQFEEAT